MTFALNGAETDRMILLLKTMIVCRIDVTGEAVLLTTEVLAESKVETILDLNNTNVLFYNVTYNLKLIERIRYSVVRNADIA